MKISPCITPVVVSSCPWPMADPSGSWGQAHEGIISFSYPGLCLCGVSGEVSDGESGQKEAQSCFLCISTFVYCFLQMRGGAAVRG